MRIIFRRRLIAKSHVRTTLIVIDPRSMVISPQIDKLTGELCTIVSEQIFWSASQSNGPVENLDDVLASEPVSNFDCQSFTCEDIDNRQRPELLTIAELIMDEVEAPSFIRLLRLNPRFMMDDHLTTPWPFCAQYQVFLAIKSIDEIATNVRALTSEHDVHTSIAISNPCPDDLVHPL